MGCDYYISAKKPTKIRFICYNCGLEIHPELAWSIKDHEYCSREVDGTWKIPIDIDVDNDDFKAR